MREKLYKLEEREGYTSKIRAEIDIEVPHEEEDAPSLGECRWAVLELGRTAPFNGHAYVIYDRLLSRIVDGVYFTPLAQVLTIVEEWNREPQYFGDHRAPNGAALGLHYPKRKQAKQP